MNEFEGDDGQAQTAKAAEERNPALYCPVCSARLEGDRCKLVCRTCGYYLSCSDYY